MSSPLISDLMLPELERQLLQDPELWPNVKGLFIITVAKRRKPAAVWYLLLQGNYRKAFYFYMRARSSFDKLGADIQPVITSDEKKARAASKVKVKIVKIQIEDTDLLNFITGG
jgi:hypothetical protein